MTTLPSTMTGVLLVGHGGFDRLAYRTDLPVPIPGAGEVLVRVRAAGVNNTDINMRTGWYSKSVTEGATAVGGEAGFVAVSTRMQAGRARRSVFRVSRAPTLAARSSRSARRSTRRALANG